MYNTNDRIVVNCFPYNGEEVLVMLKMMIQQQFVDYYIITEGYFSHTGVQKLMQFNHNAFG